MIYTITIETEDGRIFALDTVDSSTVDGQMRVTNSPLANGEVIVDHAFREGKTVSVSGQYSLSGSQYTTFNGQRPISLLNFEEEFEKIQKELVRCSIYKISKDEATNNFRFIKRDNMILKGLNWTEDINSVKFDFDFTEVLLADVITYEMDPDDDLLPYLSEPIPTSFSEQFISKEDIIKILIKYGKDNKFWSDSFLQKFSEEATSSAALIGIGAAGILGGLGIAGLGSILGITVGLLPIVGIIGGIAAIGYGIFKLISNFAGGLSKNIKGKYIFDFNPDNPKENEKNYELFVKLLDSIYNVITNEVDENFQTYTIGDSSKSSEEDVEATYNDKRTIESIVTLGSTYIILTFTRSNTLDKWIVSLSSNTGEYINQGDNFKDISTCPTNYGDTKLSDAIGTIEGFHLFVFAPQDESKLKDLSKYTLIITNKNPEEFSKQIEEICKEQLYSFDFNSII